MANMNISMNSRNYPFLLKPSGKDYLWGGNRLNKEFGKNIELSPLAETWECSTNDEGPSYVASGEWSGKKLVEVLKEHPEFLGTNPKTKNGNIPILVKFIDAKEDLSVQVHPNDKYAFEFEEGQLGKTEMWYVLDAKKDSTLVYGFNSNMRKDLIKESINDGSIEKYLNRVKVQKDDVFYIKAGIVHAIGAGTIIVEIQENSNLTYRIYDYNRTDKNGKLRKLHINKALDVIDYETNKEVKQLMRVCNYKKGYSIEPLLHCEYFKVYKERINTQNCKTRYSFQTKSNSFHILLCIEGSGTIINDKEKISFLKGDCVFVPANSVELKIKGKVDFLNISC